MIVSDTPDLTTIARDTFVLPTGTAAKMTMVASPWHERPSPNAFLVEQSPGCIAPPHFHNNSQFQVVVAGSGRIGPHRVRPIALHYAGQQTGYGPIVAGDDGITYCTLRGIMEDNAFLLPEMKDAVDRSIPKYQTYTDVVPPLGADALRVAAAGDVTPMIAPQPGGLGAWLVRVGARRTAPPPVHANGAGCFYLVMGGSLRMAGTEIGRFGCVWLDAAEIGAPLAAGGAGAEVLVLQFPANAWAYRPTRRAAHQERAVAG